MGFFEAAALDLKTNGLSLSVVIEFLELLIRTVNDARVRSRAE
jgi:hypothetical protein